jgi:hypothetical protein
VRRIMAVFVASVGLYAMALVGVGTAGAGVPSAPPAPATGSKENVIAGVS